jgi:hypothetical protein
VVPEEGKMKTPILVVDYGSMVTTEDFRRYDIIIRGDKILQDRYNQWPRLAMVVGP